jgi:hypothetical protein
MAIRVSNVVFPCVKLLAFASLFENVQMFPCLLSVSHEKVVSVLDGHYLQIPFTKIFIYLEKSWLQLVIF